MTTIRRIGPIYELDGLRLQDIDAGCGTCGKRAAEVIHDPSAQWNTGQVICVDEGVACRISEPIEPAPFVLRPSWRAPGLRVAVCQLCRYTSMPTSLEQAARWAQQHQAASHGSAA